MKRKYLISSIVSIAVITMAAMTGCSPALSDREAYDESEKTGVVFSPRDIALLSEGKINGSIHFPLPYNEAPDDGFYGEANGVLAPGDRYLDQAGSVYTLNNGRVEAPKDEAGNYFYNDADNMLVWFMVKSYNFEKSVGLNYTFPLKVSATFVLNDNGFNPDDDFSSEDLTAAYPGQFGGITIGFIDNMVDQNQNGGIMLKAINDGDDSDSVDYLLLQIPDVSTASGDTVEMMNIAYTGSEGNTNFITSGTPFTITLEIAGNSTSSAGPTLIVKCGEAELFPEGTSQRFNGSTYANYVGDSTQWGLIKTVLVGLFGSDAAGGTKIWSMLWSGGSIAVAGIELSEIPGCISDKTGMAIFACDLGINQAGEKPFQRSVQLWSMEMTYTGPLRP